MFLPEIVQHNLTIEINDNSNRGSVLGVPLDIAHEILWILGDKNFSIVVAQNILKYCMEQVVAGSKCSALVQYKPEHAK